jgi:hypothetical protein
VPTSRIPHVASAVTRSGCGLANWTRADASQGSARAPGAGRADQVTVVPDEPLDVAGHGQVTPGLGPVRAQGDGLSTHHDEFILAAGASATTSRSGHDRRPAPTHSVQIGLANLWQTAVAGPPRIQPAGHVPRLSCWFVVEPPPESNRRPHPYHGTTRNRCAHRRLPRSRSTVGAKVMGSPSAKGCAHFPVTLFAGAPAIPTSASDCVRILP